MRLVMKKKMRIYHLLLEVNSYFCTAQWRERELSIIVYILKKGDVQVKEMYHLLQRFAVTCYLPFSLGNENEIPREKDVATIYLTKVYDFNSLKTSPSNELN